MAITKIAQVDVGSGGASSISFSSIPATYTDLQILLSCKTTNAGNGIILLNINSITSSTYTTEQLRGESGVSAIYQGGWGLNTSTVLGLTGGTNVTANTFASFNIYIPNYAVNSTKYFSSEYAKESNDITLYENGISTGNQTSSAIISSIQLTAFTVNFAQYSSATLYGISKSGATGASVS
jgi:hypothetical protein